MRVISGSAKGHPLKPVPGTLTRPITDRVKESLFNILGPRVEGCRFLDLFAGTGSVGIEALSRGAEVAVFVERYGLATSIIRQNLATTGLSDHGTVLKEDVFDFLETTVEPAFDLVYAGPPQYQSLWDRTLLALDSRPELISRDGWAIVQIWPKEHEPLELEHLVERDSRQYGSSRLLFFEKRPRGGNG